MERSNPVCDLTQTSEPTNPLFQQAILEAQQPGMARIVAKQNRVLDALEDAAQASCDRAALPLRGSFLLRSTVSLQH